MKAASGVQAALFWPRGEIFRFIFNVVDVREEGGGFQSEIPIPREDRESWMNEVQERENEGGEGEMKAEESW